MIVDVVWVFLAVAFWGGDYSTVTHRTEQFQTRGQCMQKRSEVIDVAEKYKAEDPKFSYQVACIPVANPAAIR